VSKDAVRAYYASFGEREWQRLTNPDDGAIEFALTKQLLARYLPPSGRILDLGGGPGRYTIWLAERGYQVVLADLSPELLAIARTQIVAAGVDQQVEAIVEADACDLSRWPGASFDAVLCLGPFYHLPDPADRARAATELARVLRPGGIAAVAFMPRYALLRRTLALADERQHLSAPRWLERLLQHGIFENDIPGRFTHGYGAHPVEIGPFFAHYGLQMLTLAASEGIAGGIQAEVADMVAADPGVRDIALDILVETATDPSILGMASHLLYIGQREETPDGSCQPLGAPS
jgi:SAM-dependent methyltransferase